MSKINERILPKEVNTDISPLYLGNDKASFIRGIDYALYGSGTDMVYKPEESNKLYDSTFVPPVGANYGIGRKVSVETNEVYVLAYNSNQQHFIYRIKDNKCEYVYRGKELGFILDPLHFIMQGRIEVVQYKIGDIDKTFLIWTDNNDDQHFLCVEDSIATDSFNDTAFPYFKTKYPKREYLLLGLRAFTDCIQIKEVPSSGKGLNKLKFKTWKFRISGYDVYGRPLEHGKISDTFYIPDCTNDNTQCLDLTFDLLSPLVDKVAIEFSNDCGVNWKRHALIDKYEPCKGDYWQRSINKSLSIVDNKITYRFCPGEQCLAITSDQTKRNFNPVPNKSGGVIKLQNGIALVNNEYDQKPFSCDVLDKIKFSVENPLPDNQTDITISNRTITVWMMIYNPQIERPQAIWTLKDRNVWGGIGAGIPVFNGLAGKYHQNLAETDSDGFVGYLSDGSVAVSRQYKFKSEVSNFIYKLLLQFETLNKSNEDDWIYSGSAASDELINNIYLQKFEFKNVRPGKYLFRIAGHTAKLTEDYKSTSTYFGGLLKFKGKFPDVFTPFEARELEVDVCEKDYDGMKENQVVYVYDLTSPTSLLGVSTTKASSFYLYEDNDNDKGINPIAHASVLKPVTSLFSGGSVQMNHTDYNGFWFGAYETGGEVTIVAKVNRLCKEENLVALEWKASEGYGLKSNIVFATNNWADFQKEKCNRIIIKGKVADCENGNGMPGITVALTGGLTTVTDGDGNYELVTYDWKRIYNENQLSRNDKLFFITSGRCRVVNCDDAVCIPSLPVIRPSCDNCKERIIMMPLTKVKRSNKNIKGLQLGGRYPLGVGGADWMDRKGFVQHKQEWLMDIPTVNEMGVFGFPRIKWQIDPSVTFAPWIERLYFYWGKNVKYTDFHSWVVDRIEFIDATGSINNISPTQIRIHYSSLNEYNKQYNYSTNSTWQVIDEKDSLIVTDTVHFIGNGDYTLFPKNITALVRSDKQGQYFQIDYTTDLKDLKEGALFKLFREPECAETELYYEVCETIDVEDGKPVRNFGYLNIYDSYFVDRQIPTPFVQTKKVKKAVDGAANPIVYTEVEESESVNVLKSYGWPFEHHSPSDFWGIKCGNYGRVNAKNDLENIVRKEDQLALSGGLGVNGNTNYLHYFDKDRVKEFGREYGSITAALVKGNNVVVICRNKTFVSVYDDNTVRISQDGAARVLSGDKQFSNPQNVRLFGCREQDRNVIATDGNVIGWVDGSRIEVILHDFADGQDIVKGKFESFIRRKIKSIDRSHKKDTKVLRYLHGEINPKNGSFTFTDYKIDSASCVNNSYDAQIEGNETVCVDIQSKSLRRFAHYTPEMYASLPGEDQDKQLFSFKNALPYSHYNNSESSLNFFGVQCQPMIKIAMATDPLLFKNTTSIIIHCDNIVFFAKEVITHTKQKSWIPRNWFKRVNKYWIAPFLCDLNSLTDKDKPLTNGEKLRAKGIEVLLVGDPDNSNKYFELTAIEINAIKT